MTILQGKSGMGLFYLAKQKCGWVGFTQHNTAIPIPVSSIEEGLAMCDKDETGGLSFSLLEVRFIKTIKEMGLYT